MCKGWLEIFSRNFSRKKSKQVTRELRRVREEIDETKTANTLQDCNVWILVVVFDAGQVTVVLFRYNMTISSFTISSTKISLFSCFSKLYCRMQ